MNPASPSEVLTLEEVADYLRLPPETILQQATHGTLPGRNIDNTWRFLRSAINDWLRAQNSRTILLQQAGALADDTTLADLRTAIYTARERPEINDASAP